MQIHSWAGEKPFWRVVCQSSSDVLLLGLGPGLKPPHSLSNMVHADDAIHFLQLRRCWTMSQWGTSELARACGL